MARPNRSRALGVGFLALVVAAGAATAVVLESPAGAGSYSVTTTADTPDVTPGDGTCADAGSDCSLRAAVMEANATAGDDQIVLPAGTFRIGLTGDEDNAATGDLDIRPADGAGVSITGAGASQTAIDGGGVDRVVHVVSGSVTMAGVSIRGGLRGTGAGGGVLVATGASLTLQDVEVRGNAATDGAGIRNDGTTTVSRVLVTGNSGAPSLSSGAGTLNVVNSTVSTNSGVGVRASGGSLGLTQVTVTGNTGNGVEVTGGTVTLRNSIVSGNEGSECAGTVGSQGFNVVDDTSCGPGANDRPNADPALGPLAANGGPTSTHAPASTSPAVDLVAQGQCPVGDDQRRATRPQDGNGDGSSLCDAGALELGQSPSAPASTTTTTRPGQGPPAGPVTAQPTTAG